MAETAQIDFTIDGAPAAKTLGELEIKAEQLSNALKDAKLGSAEYSKLNQQLVQTNKQVKNLELGFEALDNEGVASQVGALAGAIGDVTGAMILLGGENETVAKMAANIQQAMGISMAFKGAIEGASAAMKLFNNVVRANPFVLIGLAIAAVIAGIVLLIKNFDVVKDFFLDMAIWVKDTMDGFGKWKYAILALLGPIGLLYAAWDFFFGEQIKNLSEIEKAQKREFERQTAARKEASAAHNERLKQIREQLAAEKNAYDSRQESFDLEIARLEAEGKNSDLLKRKKIEDTLEFEKIQLESINAQIASWTKYYEDLFVISGKSREDFIKQMKGQGIDLVKLQEQANEVLLDQQKKIYSAETELIKFNREVREKNHKETKDENNDLYEQEQALLKARMDFLMQLEAAENEYLDSKLTAQQREENAVRDKYFFLIEEAVKFGEDTAILEEAQRQRMIEIQQKYDQIAADAKKKADDEAAAKEQERIDRNVAAAESLFNSLSGFADMLHQKELKRANEKIARGEALTQREIKRLQRQDKIEKAFALAKIIKDTATGISGAIAAGSGVPFPGNLFAIATGVAAVLAGITQASQVLGDGPDIPSSSGDTNTAIPDSGGQNTNVPVINPVQAGSTFLNQEPQKVYVVESDITGVQGTVKSIVKEATF